MFYDQQSCFAYFTLLNEFAYDNNGNLTSVDFGTSSVSYAYDSANQIIRENNSFADRTWVWTYDDAGNILSRSEYAYTTGTLGAPLNTVTYSYGDAAYSSTYRSISAIRLIYCRFIIDQSK